MKDFVAFLQRRVYRPLPIDDSRVEEAFLATSADVRYRNPDATNGDIETSIERGRDSLSVFLFRLGQAIRADTGTPELLDQVHWLLRDLCACELYFNNEIGAGFTVVHGEGTVIGSRNVIGRGFTVHHGCTIGHRSNGEGAGSRIGDDVTLYAGSSILGERSIGDRVIIGASMTIIGDLPDDTVVTITQPSFKRRT